MRIDRITVKGKRKGVSPIVAELCTVAVVLIAVVLLSSILYGAMSIYESPAEVAVQQALCSANSGSEICQFVLANLGAQVVSTDGQCAMTLQGSVNDGTVHNGGPVPAGGTLSGVACVVSGTIALAGAQISGSIALTNGALVYFIATTN
jgi:flagellin-like protein